MSIRTTLILMVLVAIASASLTKFYFPNVQTKTETVEKEVVRTDVVTVTKEIIKNDGSKEIVTTVTDKSVKKSDSTHTDVKLAIKPEYIFSGGIVTNFKEKPDYKVGVGKRLFGPVFGQVSYQTNNSFHFDLVMEF